MKELGDKDFIKKNLNTLEDHLYKFSIKDSLFQTIFFYVMFVPLLTSGFNRNTNLGIYLSVSISVSIIFSLTLYFKFRWCEVYFFKDKIEVIYTGRYWLDFFNIKNIKMDTIFYNDVVSFSLHQNVGQFENPMLIIVKYRYLNKTKKLNIGGRREDYNVLKSKMPLFASKFTSVS